MTSRPARLLAPALAAAFLAAGCASATARPAPQAPSMPAVPSVPPSLATSLVTAGGSWAAAVMGTPASQAQHLLAAVRPPGHQHRMEAGDPPGSRHQRRPGPGRPGRKVAADRFPPRRGPHLLRAHHHRRQRRQLVAGQPARPRTGRRARCPRRRPGIGSAHRPAGGRQGRAVTRQRRHLGGPDQRAVAGRVPGRPAVRADRPDGCLLRADGRAPARRDLQEPGHGRDLLLHRRAVAAGRTLAGPGAGCPARRGAPADQPSSRPGSDGQGNGREHSPPGLRHGDGREPAARPGPATAAGTGPCPRRPAPARKASGPRASAPPGPPG